MPLPHSQLCSMPVLTMLRAEQQVPHAAFPCRRGFRSPFTLLPTLQLQYPAEGSGSDLLARLSYPDSLDPQSDGATVASARPLSSAASPTSSLQKKHKRSSSSKSLVSYKKSNKSHHTSMESKTIMSALWSITETLLTVVVHTGTTF